MAIMIIAADAKAPPTKTAMIIALLEDSNAQLP